MRLASTSQEQVLNPEQWPKKYKGYLSAMAFKKLPQDMVEDIVQDTFLAALSSAHRFEGTSSERVWLTAILKHKIADHYRTANPKYGRILSNTIFESELPQWHNLNVNDNRPYSSTFDGLYEDDLNELLIEAMGTLTRSEIAVLELKKKGYSTEAICGQLNITRSHSWVALCKARKKLKEYLNQKW